MGKLDKRYEEPIGVAVIAASSVGPAGVLFPVFDMAGIGVIWTAMVAAIADRSEHEANGAAVAKVVTAAVGAASGYALGSKILSWLLIALFPLAGIGTAAAANAALNGLFTLKLGVATAKQFDRPDFDALDIMNIAQSIAAALTPVPSADEIAMLKSIFT